ncbi:putative GTP-binding protein 6 isoform X1 [Pantherophis guttatus]|uniref:Putative GTP-binding protein 6 n=1 Tax=Pantherophis guttatus TaxID=94885 RepID=A0A6P9CVQ7_PANGU|nr:putative GTP-binding protein 6 isoform X1 [Pantherophis guttatus]
MIAMGSQWRQLQRLVRILRPEVRLLPASCQWRNSARFWHNSAVHCRQPPAGNGSARGKSGAGGTLSSWGTEDNEEGDLVDNDDDEEEEEDDLDDVEDLDVEDKLLEESRLPFVTLEAQKVFIVHPAVKWGPDKPKLTTAELQLAEAVTLINTLQNWTVIDTIILPIQIPDKKFIFHKGNFQLLTEKIKRLPLLSSVFVNVEMLSPITKKELEKAWGLKVFDRYTIVLHIFRCNAQTKEAKLQIALAELPLLRTNVRNEVAQLDQQRGGSRYIMGSGETFMEIQLRLLKEKEVKIRKALRKLKKNRSLLRKQRKKSEFPIISVMGYTNCGKTTLIKSLTGDAKLQPRDQLFATLDITAHAGYLPSRLTVLYVDTIGFLSQLPHNLVESFSATLEDVACSDLIVHVRDVSHPETSLQKKTVLSVLKNLNIPNHLLESIIEVHNKVDLVDRYQPEEQNAIVTSALLGYGLKELKEEIEARVLKGTGKKNMTIKINLSGPQLSWLYKEAVVQEVDVAPEDNTAKVKVIISDSALWKCKRLFPQSSYLS